jgi:cytoskeletal protein CcmA (bactofilin family)
MSKTHDELKSAEQFRHGSTVVSGLRIRGQISGSEDLVIEGTVEGPINLAENVLTIGTKGNLAGDAVAREAVISGNVNGNLKTSDRIEIKSSGSVIGDVATNRMVIQDGAYYKGSIEIG